MKMLLIIALFFGWTQLMGEQKEMSTAEALKQKHIQEQLEKEKKFAQEQKFYKADEYDFSEQEIDPKDVETIPTIEPENDFDMTDVYRDDI
jgi:hypothetical protein